MDGEDAPDELLTRLYAEEPATFIARRTALARELRQQGRPEIARAVGALRRPTLSVWAADRLHEASPADLRALLDAGRQLREAQLGALEGRATEDLRSLMAAHSGALQRAVEEAAATAAERGHPLSGVEQQRLQTTLRSVSLGPPEVQAALEAGRLTSDRGPEGFGGLEGLEVSIPPAGSPAARPRGLRRPDPVLARRAREARARAERQAEVARQATREAEALRDRAARLAREAQSAAAGAAAEAERAEALEREARAAEEAAGGG
jgi:hypothetical protein